tara:strand:+ start:73 stop:426 length:354 start_codon:yes stop_codon:yes gene_type:complete
MSLIDQFNSTCISLFDLLIDDKSSVTINYIRDYLFNCKVSSDKNLIEKFVINILPYYEKIKEKKMSFLESKELSNIFDNRISIKEYLSSMEKNEMIFLYLSLLCDMSIEYLKKEQIL